MMLQETEVKAAEDLTAALNNFNGLTQEVIEANKAALKEELDDLVSQGFDDAMGKVQSLIDKGKTEIQETATSGKQTITEDTANAQKVISTGKNEIQELITQGQEAITNDKQDGLDELNAVISQAKQDITNQKNTSIENITGQEQQSIDNISAKENASKSNIIAQENASITTLAEKTEGHCTTLNNKIETGENALQTKITEGTNLLETTKAEKVNELHSTYESDIQDLQDKYNELQAALNNTNATFEQKKAEMLINIFTQTVFVQFPNMPIPDTFLSFEGYRWAEVNYGGAFFRAAGGHANGFNGGLQEDAIRNITGELVGLHLGFYYSYIGVEDQTSHCKGVFTVERSNLYHRAAGVDKDKNNIKAVFDASRVVPTAEENRPVNYTVRLWKLEKI